MTVATGGWWRCRANAVQGPAAADTVGAMAGGAGEKKGGGNDAAERGGFRCTQEARFRALQEENRSLLLEQQRKYTASLEQVVARAMALARDRDMALAELAKLRREQAASNPEPGVSTGTQTLALASGTPVSPQRPSWNVQLAELKSTLVHHQEREVKQLENGLAELRLRLLEANARNEACNCARGRGAAGTGCRWV